MAHKNSSAYLWVGKCIEDSEPNNKLKEYLSSGELKRADTFHFKKDSRRYIYAHATLRLLLSQYSRTHPQRLDFLLNPAGKPSLTSYPSIRFNLSRTKDMVAIAVALDHDVGVDIEKCVPLENLNNVAKKIMTGHEFDSFNALGEVERLSFFYKCWVRKEAVVKAWGKGIDDNLDKLDVMGEDICCGAKKTTIYDEYWKKEWTIRDFIIADGCVGAVCAEGGDFELIMKDISTK